MTHDPVRVATRASWRIQPCPAERAPLHITAVYLPSEFDRIRAGLIPMQMEDKWFIFYEAPWLYLHRSWTGHCIYGVRLEESSQAATIVESWVSRNVEHYRGADTEYEEKLLKFLIDTLLLNKSVPFPVAVHVPTTVRGVYQHTIVGRAFPEMIMAPTPRPRRSLWQWLRDRFSA